MMESMPDLSRNPSGSHCSGSRITRTLKRLEKMMLFVANEFAAIIWPPHEAANFTENGILALRALRFTLAQSAESFWITPVVQLPLAHTP
jgi:hypothetical protein